MQRVLTHALYRRDVDVDVDVEVRMQTEKRCKLVFRKLFGCSEQNDLVFARVPLCASVCCVCSFSIRVSSPPVFVSGHMRALVSHNHTHTHTYTVVDSQK